MMEFEERSCEDAGLDHAYEFVLAAHGAQVFRCTRCHHFEDVIEDALQG